jgi:DNA-binding MarR family transcriptional regulator
MKIGILKRMPGHLIRRAQQASSAIFSEEMAEFDLTSVQFIALVAIADSPGLDATRVGELIDVDKATIGGVIERLERKGLIDRRRSQEDGRVKVLAATRAARALITICFSRVEAVQERILAPLSVGERATLLELLHKLTTGQAAEPTDFVGD